METTFEWDLVRLHGERASADALLAARRADALCAAGLESLAWQWLGDMAETLYFRGGEGDTYPRGFVGVQRALQRHINLRLSLEAAGIEERRRQRDAEEAQ